MRRDKNPRFDLQIAVCLAPHADKPWEPKAPSIDWVLWAELDNRPKCWFFSGQFTILKSPRYSSRVPLAWEAVWWIRNEQKKNENPCQSSGDRLSFFLSLRWTSKKSVMLEKTFSIKVSLSWRKWNGSVTKTSVRDWVSSLEDAFSDNCARRRREN